jgi:predicted PurR-regulated permease PerM
VLTFFFLRDFDRMRLAAVEYLPAHNRDWWLERIAQMNVVVGAWFRGQVEVAAILSLLYAVGLGVVFGIAGIGVISGVAIGLLSGLLNIIPYFGFLIGIVLSVLLAVLDWHGLGPLIGVIVVFAVVQGLEGYVVTPRVVGEKVGLPPVVVIITLLIGGQVLGLLGVLLAIPIAGVIRVLVPDAIGWYRRSDLYTGAIPSQTVPEPKAVESPTIVVTDPAVVTHVPEVKT